MDDVIVIGGSFAGLAAALQIARARRKVTVLDTGEPRNRFAKAAHGVLAQDGKPPLAILDEGRNQLLQYPTARILTVRAEEARAEGDVFVVGTAQGGHRARRLILAYGLRDDLPDLPGLAECWGVSVLHCPYCHAHEFSGRKLGIIFSTEHSIQAARMLQDWSREVTLFTGGKPLDEESRGRLSGWSVRIAEDPLAAVEHDGGQMRGMRLSDGKSVPLDAAFIHTRHPPCCDLALRLGCAMEDGPLGPFVRVAEGQETSIPGIYAAGDLASPQHNISWAIAHGASAGIAAHQSLIA